LPQVELQRRGDTWQAAKYTATQVFHENFTDVDAFIAQWLGSKFRQLHAWDGEYEYARRITKKGKVLESKRKSAGPPRPEFAQGFDRAKKRAVERLPIPVKDMKLAQVNRFLEVISHELQDLEPGAQVNVIDFGCGKSYLTFALWHYLAQVRNFNVEILGLDLREDVVQACRAAATEHGITGIDFRVGEIGKLAQPMPRWHAPRAFNIVISLHACDTATDDALAAAMGWGAALICAVPCCQHSLRNNMQLKELRLLHRYPVLEERFAALATDALRAALLEENGYSVDIVEFAPLSFTAKNLMLRAKFTGKKNPAITAEISAVEGLI
jgi:2-polyprenyl-3-methyl-5-hydroxy-6-metoxy-1,4-benzoquinol methylase